MPWKVRASKQVLDLGEGKTRRRTVKIGGSVRVLDFGKDPLYLDVLPPEVEADAHLIKTEVTAAQVKDAGGTILHLALPAPAEPASASPVGSAPAEVPTGPAQTSAPAPQGAPGSEPSAPPASPGPSSEPGTAGEAPIGDGTVQLITPKPGPNRTRSPKAKARGKAAKGKRPAAKRSAPPAAATAPNVEPPQA